MIPPTIDRANRSPGEREIFRRLRDDPNTAGWTVLHSLDLTHHPDQIAGEIDFVVVVPAKGVLCIEVKACLSLQRKDGLWFYGRNNVGDPRGPFKQASSGMHGLRERIAERLPSLRHVLFWSAVIFPYIPFRESSDEWHPWQVIDASRFKAQPLSRSVEEVLDAAWSYLASRPSAAWFHGGARLDTTQSLQLVGALRPEFEIYESVNSRVARRESELKRYTAEQFLALDNLQSCERAIYAAPAGAGKTLLALEMARRAASENRRTLLLCYNRFLGEAIRSDVEPYKDIITATTFHGYLLRIARASIAPDHTGPDYWENVLPQLAIEALLANEGTGLYDELVVDEAQDLMSEQYLDLLDLSLKGGLAAGRWRFFGDFEKQAIFDRGESRLEQFITERCVGTPIYHLRVNCRNPPRIASLSSLLGGMDPPYARILRQDDGQEADLKFFASSERQIELLQSSLAELERDGYRPSEIVVLSPRASGCCAESMPRGPWRDRMTPFGSSRNDLIRWTTIHAFKGLESPVVILTDVDEIAGTRGQSLFYIGVTRATERLVILADSRVRPEVIGQLTRKNVLSAAPSA